jgi:hypothetical protein
MKSADWQTDCNQGYFARILLKTNDDYAKHRLRRPAILTLFGGKTIGQSGKTKVGRNLRLVQLYYRSAGEEIDSCTEKAGWASGSYVLAVHWPASMIAVVAASMASPIKTAYSIAVAPRRANFGMFVGAIPVTPSLAVCLMKNHQNLPYRWQMASFSQVRDLQPRK